MTCHDQPPPHSSVARKTAPFRFVLAAVLFPAVLTFAQTTAPLSRIDIPSFAANATTVYGTKSAASPDGKKRVHLREFENEAGYHPAEVIVETENGRFTKKITFGLNAEVLWSPDSKAFSITGSCCGANGNYETDVFFVRKARLDRVRITPLAIRSFGHPVKCGWPEFPNVAAIKWIVASRELLVAAEIMHHSNCDSFGTFRAYLVDLAGPRLSKSYDQLEAKRLYMDDLGMELLQSDDKCIHDPKSCWVTANHMEY